MIEYSDKNMMLWVWLSVVLDTSKSKIWSLLDEFETAENICRELTSGNKIFSDDEIKRSSRTHAPQIQSIISYCQSHNIGIINYADERYPQHLKSIFNPPVVLYYRGNAEILCDDMIIAVVGARNISSYSEKVAGAVARVAVENGITVASGFAVGTDITAHLAAVRNGGRTIAVLGNGIDYNYPEVNIKYTDEILSNGVFVSEYPPQMSARPANFLARNRILTGLSMGTAVIEASRKSGSLNSASHAISQGRDLWVVSPHDMFDERYEGNKMLLMDGATPIYSPFDIPREYFENFSHKPIHESITDYVTLDGIEGRGNTPKKAKEPQERTETKPVPELEGTQKIIYDILKKESSPMSADEVAAIAEIDITEILSVMTDMEIEGIITSDAGQTYYIQ